MSRSHKHTPYYTDCGKRGGPARSKRCANKKVRRMAMELPHKGKSYKKCYCTYDIHDYCYYEDIHMALAFYEKYKDERWFRETKEDFLHRWYQRCRMK